MAADTKQSGLSPFLDPGPVTKAGSLAIVQLSRDNLLPIYLQEAKGEHDGYAEGVVINTRYGSFPHSTMINVPWGSQIRASQVDTGSRGRKRKRAPDEDAGPEDRNNRPDSDTGTACTKQRPGGTKQAVAATSGFIHVLPPTPELWTASLPHRTQVVYTPDYSYVLHRIRARPGTRLIEAGSGSGSFTHASARAVYNGYPRAGGARRRGKVFSFEFHEARYHKMKKELADHELEGVVQLTHRDVYKGGFLVDGKSPEADAIFLDLPAPWDALPHLSRRRPRARGEETGDKDGWVSPLNPKKSVHICTFSPCIEQVSRTVSAMRRLGWVDIDMVEIANRKLQVYRERIGLNIPVEKGASVLPANVAEAVTRLAEIEERFREQQQQQLQPRAPATAQGDRSEETPMEVDDEESEAADGDPLLARRTAKSASAYKPFMEGRMITRGETEIKTHTSYLVFAVLPREWTEEDEAEALRRWPCGGEKGIIGALDKAARKQEKRERLAGKRKTAEKAVEEAEDTTAPATGEE